VAGDTPSRGARLIPRARPVGGVTATMEPEIVEIRADRPHPAVPTPAVVSDHGEGGECENYN